MANRSYSQISLFEGCPQKWFYAYIRKMREPTPKAFAFGGDVHRMLAKMWDTADVDLSKGLAFKYMEDSEGARRDAEVLVRSAKRVLLREGIGEFDFSSGTLRMDVEKRLPSNPSSVGFLGYVDLIAWDGEHRACVVDYKTTSAMYDERDIVVSDQLTAYAWIFYLEYSFLPVHVAFVTLNKITGEVKTYHTQRSLADVEAWEKKVRAVSKLMQAKTVWKNPGACVNRWGQCYFFNMCHSGEAHIGGDRIREF